MLTRNLLHSSLLLSLLLAIPAFSANAQGFQWPDKSENLKILPKNTSGQDLGRIMRGFTRALGVRCEHCHDDTDGNQLSQMDFAADTKESKEIAREMLSMVMRINTTELKSVSDLTGTRAIEVTCVTCHRGNRKPVMIEDVLMETTQESGVDEAITEYERLRERYYGGFTYDFSEQVLTRVAGRLSSENNADAALAFLNHNLTHFPESWQTYVSIGQTYQQMNRMDEAIASVEKAIELNPNAGFLKRMLSRMKGE